VISTAELDPAIEAIIGSMAVPIGLAIEDIAMRGVDLLPKDAVKTKSRRASVIAIGAPVAVAVPLVALGFLYLGAHGKVSDNQAELDAVKAEIAALPTPTGPDIDASVVGDEAVRATAVASVLGGRLAWDAVFRDMARVLPSNVWLTSLSASLPQGGNLADGLTAPVAVTVPGQAAAAPTAVVLEGYTYTQPDVARLLARLATLPSLRRVTLNTSQRETVGKKEVVRFVIVADLSQTGGAS
jgi:Tfp pilus assembly protein PilN